MDQDILEITKAGTAATMQELVAQLFSLFKSPQSQKAITRKQKASSEALLTKIETECGLSREEVQSIQRAMLLESIKDSNYLAVISKAIPEIKDLASVKNVNKDWLLLHHERASMFSNEEIQYLWAKILAGELNHAGSFSRRTLQIVDQLEDTDARLFKKLGTFFYKIDNETVLIMFGPNCDSEKIVDISWMDLTRLESLGLIYIAPSVGFKAPEVFLPVSQPKISCSYFDRKGIIHFDNKEPAEGTYNLPLGIATLTSAGEELSLICEPEANMDLFDYIRRIWQKRGCEYVGN